MATKAANYKTTWIFFMLLGCLHHADSSIVKKTNELLGTAEDLDLGDYWLPRELNEIWIGPGETKENSLPDEKNEPILL